MGVASSRPKVARLALAFGAAAGGGIAVCVARRWWRQHLQEGGPSSSTKGCAEDATPATTPPASASAAPLEQSDSADDEGFDFDKTIAEERLTLQEAVRAVRLVRKTGAYRALAHPHAVEKQLSHIEAQIDEIAGYLSGHMVFWRYGRCEPMASLLELPLFRLAAQHREEGSALGAMVPVTAGFVKDSSVSWRQGELAVARFLVSGTDASASRYHESSHGILDSLRRDQLLQRLQKMFWSVWDLPLTWGDEDDCMPLGGSVNPHNVSAFGVAMRTQWENFGASTGLSS